MEIMRAIWQHFCQLHTWKTIARSMLGIFGILWIAEASGLHGLVVGILIIICGLILAWTMVE